MCGGVEIYRVAGALGLPTVSKGREGGGGKVRSMPHAFRAQPTAGAMLPETYLPDLSLPLCTGPA